MHRYRSEHRSPLGDELLPHLSRHLGSGHHPARYRIQHEDEDFFVPIARTKFTERLPAHTLPTM
jgi:hypothetical protein